MPSKRFFILLGLVGLVNPAGAQDFGYQQPPRALQEVMRAPPQPTPLISPTQDRMLLVSHQDYPSIAQVAAPFLRLAGARVQPANRSKHDRSGGNGIRLCVTALELVHIPSGRTTPVALPADACPDTPRWSADGQQFAFANVTEKAVQLWLGNADSGALRQVPGVHLNPMLDSELHWMPDQKTLLVKAVVTGTSTPPSQSISPVGPSIQESSGRSGQSSTYERRDTLNNAHDEALFDYYAATQLALVNTQSLALTPIGGVGNYEALQPAPDGRHVLVTSLHRPYSYVTTHRRFPRDVQVWDLADPAKVTVHTLTSRPLADRVPIHGVPQGPRDFSWRATDAATLVWTEALDGGDWSTRVSARDRLMMQAAPFSTAPKEVARAEQRINSVAWTDRADVALLNEYDHNRHWLRTYALNVDAPSNDKRLLWSLSSEEKYAAPGTPHQRTLANGVRVVRIDDNAIYLAGAGAAPGGARPFLDKLHLDTLQKERLFRSDADAHEQFLAFGPGARPTLLTWHQSVVSPPNVHLRTLGATQTAVEGEAVIASTRVPITRITDATPQVRQISKRLVTYKRKDGLDLSFTLYTPPDYRPGQRLPTILYAYPLDYADAGSAGQVTGSQATFTRLRQYRLLLLAGYAIIDNAAFPIVGDPKSAYDRYLEQLVDNAQAAVDEAVRLGVTDHDRVGVTGHSHGALMTVNLLAHSKLFKAGVATSGAYNKTLTPFGFQNERRSLWTAPEVYRKASPFFFADKLKTPLLLVHGAEDANPGTTPLQSRTLFEAIRGNGGTVRLVMLPHEPHWYAARESNEHLVYEMVRWFDRYVKNAGANGKNQP